MRISAIRSPSHRVEILISTQNEAPPAASRGALGPLRCNQRSESLQNQLKFTSNEHQYAIIITPSCNLSTEDSVNLRGLRLWFGKALGWRGKGYYEGFRLLLWNGGSPSASPFQDSPRRGPRLEAMKPWFVLSKLILLRGPLGYRWAPPRPAKEPEVPWILPYGGRRVRPRTDRPESGSSVSAWRRPAARI